MAVEVSATYGRLVRRRRGLTLAAMSLGFAVVQLDVSVVNVAIHAIGEALGGGVTGLQWVVNAYTVAFAAFILTAGALGDRLGAKRVFIAGFAIFTAASAVCGFAPTLGVLIAARAIQGIGAAILVPGSLTLLNHAFPETADRVRAVGIWTAGASVALSLGPLVGGVLTEWAGWRAIFFINLPLGIAGIVLTVVTAEETSRFPSRGIDLPGQVAAVAGLALLAGSIIEGGSRGFTDVLVLAGFAVAAIALLAFVAIESRSESPMLPLRFFRVPTFSAATAIGLLVNVAFYGLIFVLSLFFQELQGFSALRTGLAFGPMTAVILVGNLIAGRLAARLTERWLIVAAAILMAAGLAGLLGVDRSTSYAVMVVPMMAVGFGLALIVPTMTSALLGSIDRRRSGVAAGTLNTARQTGSTIGVALFGSLIAGGAIVAGLHQALAISIVLAGAVLVLARWVRTSS